MSDEQLVAVYKALGDRRRYRLLQTLKSQKTICVSQLAEAAGISVAGMSQQLKILQRSGLIERHRLRQRICYQLSQNPNLSTILKRL